MNLSKHPYREPASLAEARTLRLVHPARATKILARMLLVFMGILLVSFIVVPWQQTSTAQGRVIAYAPVERQQEVEAPIEGRVMVWHVREGDHVEVGDAIADLSDNDPEILRRLRDERDAQVARVEASKARKQSIISRASSLGLSRNASITGADQRVRMARERTLGLERAKDAASQGTKTSQLNLDRQMALFERGLTSKRNVELAELEIVKMKTEFERAEAAVRAAKGEEQALSADLSKSRNDVTASIDDAHASQAMVDAEIASANAELARIEVRLARQGTQEVKAPRAGMILRVLARQGTDMVKAGEALAIMVPDTSDRAVELWTDGNDVPLITPGRPVRLQFEGWPAVQFSGWPELAIGTFAGTVAFVDAAADESKGKFRVVIVPSEPWPAPRFLRQGSRVNGWIFLNRVRLGYEIWRQLNGFPAVIPTREMLVDDQATKGKK